MENNVIPTIGNNILAVSFVLVKNSFVTGKSYPNRPTIKMKSTSMITTHLNVAPRMRRLLPTTKIGMKTVSYLKILITFLIDPKSNFPLAC